MVHEAEVIEYLSSSLQSLLREGQGDKVGTRQPQAIEPVVLKDKLAS